MLFCLTARVMGGSSSSNSSQWSTTSYTSSLSSVLDVDHDFDKLNGCKRNMPHLWKVAIGVRFDSVPNKEPANVPKNPKTLQQLAIAASGQSFQTGVEEALEWLHLLPFPRQLILRVHEHVTFSSAEWSRFSNRERYCPNMCPEGGRSRRIHRYYDNMYPLIKSDREWSSRRDS